MKTINDLYVVYLKHKVVPAEVPAAWDRFQAAALKVTKIEIDTPYYVEVCAKYARANE